MNEFYLGLFIWVLATALDWSARLLLAPIYMRLFCRFSTTLDDAESLPPEGFEGGDGWTQRFKRRVLYVRFWPDYSFTRPNMGMMRVTYTEEDGVWKREAKWGLPPIHGMSLGFSAGGLVMMWPESGWPALDLVLFLLAAPVPILALAYATTSPGVAPFVSSVGPGNTDRFRSLR